MITLAELLDGNNLKDVPVAHQANLNVLLEKMNIIRKAYGKPMTVTSGYRSMKTHLRIYKDKGITDTKKIPMKSRHLSGQAVDIFDPKQVLQKWCKDHEQELVKAGLYCEDFDYTKTWIHFQCIPPNSGKRFFIP